MKLKPNGSRDTPSSRAINIRDQPPSGSPQANSPISVAQAQLVQQAVDYNIQQQLSTIIDDALRSRVQLGPGHYSDLISRIERLEEAHERREREDVTFGKWSIEIDNWPNGMETLRLRKNGRERIVDMNLSAEVASADEILEEEESQRQNNSEHSLSTPLMAQRDQGRPVDPTGGSKDISEMVLADDEPGGEWEDLSASDEVPEFVSDADMAGSDDDDEDVEANGDIAGAAEAEDDTESDEDVYVFDEEDESEVFGGRIVDNRTENSPKVRIDRTGRLLQRKIDRCGRQPQPRRKRKLLDDNADEDTVPLRSRARKSRRLDYYSRADLQGAYPQDLSHGHDEPQSPSVPSTGSTSEEDSQSSPDGSNVVDQLDIATGLSLSADHVKERAAKLDMSDGARHRGSSDQQPLATEDATASATPRVRTKSNRGMLGYKLVDEDHYKTHYANKFIGVDRDPLKSRQGTVIKEVAERTRGATWKKKSEASIEDQSVAREALTPAPQLDRSADAVLINGRYSAADGEYQEESESGVRQQVRRRKKARKHGKGGR